MTRYLVAPSCCALLLVLALPTGAAQTATPTELDTQAFDRAYATSFYTFDACGDALSGRWFRQAVTERVTSCQFSTEAKAAFRERSTLQRRKSGRVIAAMIDKQGGFPVQLTGMSMTCREQQALPEYQAARSRLEKYARGEAPAADVVSGACDAKTITP